MTDLDLATILRRAEAATPGPWAQEYGNDTGPGDEGFWEFRTITSTGVDPKDPEWTAYVGRTTDFEPDAEFIAAARSDVPALVAALREAKEVLRKTQWGGGRVAMVCPDCHAAYTNGHARECRLSAAIR